MSINSLKKDKYIPKNIDVQHNILSYIDYPIELYPKYCDDSLSLYEIQKQMFKLYIGWKIKMDLEKITYAQRVYHRLCNKSFRLFEKSIDILLNEFNFSEEKVKILN